MDPSDLASNDRYALRNEQTAAGDEFFARARARLTLDVPPGLTDASIVPRRGDQ